jgi:hypothetical protein
VFPGNIQGRHARETGAKGATLVTVEDGRIVDVVHRPLDVVRWSIASLDLSEVGHVDDVIPLARDHFEALVSEAEGRMLAVQVRLHGRSAAHRALLREPDRWRHELYALATDTSGDGLWLERVEIATRSPVDIDDLARRDDPVGRIVATLQSLARDEQACREILDGLSDLQGKLPLEVREGQDGVRLDDPAVVASVLAEVEALVVPELLDDGESEP